MAAVPLTFIPPERSGFTTLEIWETTDPIASAGTLIESVTVTEPYPTEHTTQNAANANDYFAIRWLNADGTNTTFSEWLKGGTESLIGKIVQRILLRDPSINETVAAQEAEAAISEYFGVDDPSTIDPATVNPKILQGLTLLSLAWSYVVSKATSSSAGATQKFTAGLVSLDSGSSSSSNSNSAKVDLDALLKLANNLLGRNFSLIMHLPDIPVASNCRPLLKTVDLSRTIIEV